MRKPSPRAFLKDFELRNTKKPVIQSDEGKKKTIFQYEITTFSTGKKTIGPLQVAYTDAKGETHEAQADALTVAVESVLPKDAKNLQIKDIKPPIDVKYPTWYYVLGALIAIVLIALIYLLVRYIRQRIRKKKLQEAEVHKTPEEIADERLKALLNSSLLRERRIKEYYVELSDIVRQYIEGRYEIDALDRTTFELYRELKSSIITPNLVSKIKELLSLCDLVKFARLIPELHTIQGDYDETRGIIEDLRPKVPEEEKEAMP